MVVAPRPSRGDFYRVLREVLPAQALVVTALGNASYLWSAMRDAPENFYLEDAMGLALPLAVGLAIAQPERQVVVGEGDGGLLMHMGSLVTAGAIAPKNLTVLLIDNGVHGASGGQSLANQSLDLAALARSIGFTDARQVRTAEDLSPALSGALESAGPSFFALLTDPDLDVVVPPNHLDPVTVKRRFMDCIGAKPYRSTLFGGGLSE